MVMIVFEPFFQSATYLQIIILNAINIIRHQTFIHSCSHVIVFTFVSMFSFEKKPLVRISIVMVICVLRRSHNIDKIFDDLNSFLDVVVWTMNYCATRVYFAYKHKQEPTYYTVSQSCRMAIFFSFKYFPEPHRTEQKQNWISKKSGHASHRDYSSLLGQHINTDGCIGF